VRRDTHRSRQRANLRRHLIDYARSDSFKSIPDESVALAPRSVQPTMPHQKV
jgi:hypothetical protein